MTTPANLTIDQITTRVMNQLRLPTSNTTEQTKVLALINEVYRDLYVKFDWWFLLKRTVVNTVAKISTGPVSVTLGSTALTFSDATGVVTHYSFLTPGGSPDFGAVYIVASTGASTAQTLDAAYTNATSTEAAYRLYQDRIALPADTGKVLWVKRFGERIPLRKVGPEEMDGIKIIDTSEGKPEMWTVSDFLTSGGPTTQRLLIVHPYPKDAYRLEIKYKQQLNTEMALSASTQPFLPDEYRQILVYGALARGYPIFLNDTERGTYYQSLFNDLLALMQASHREYASDDPRITIQDRYRHQPRGRRAATTLGSWFDRLPYDP
mgnify:CR=1 FL=1